MSIATTGAATEAAFTAITKATKDAGSAVVDTTAAISSAVAQGSGRAKSTAGLAANYSGAARALLTA